MLDLIKTEELVCVKKVTENIEYQIFCYIFLTTHLEQSKNLDNFFKNLTDVPLVFFMYNLVYLMLVET